MPRAYALIPLSKCVPRGLGTKAVEEVSKCGQTERPHARSQEGKWQGQRGSRGQSNEVSPEEGVGWAAEATAQAPVVFSALGAGCGGAAQESELLETECVLAPGATPHGSVEEAGLAPVGRWGRGSEMPSESSGHLG